jgi:hypothetical protein
MAIPTAIPRSCPARGPDHFAIASPGALCSVRQKSRLARWPALAPQSNRVRTLCYRYMTTPGAWQARTVPAGGRQRKSPGHFGAPVQPFDTELLQSINRSNCGSQLAGEYGLRRWPIRLQASFPQRLRGTLCGRPACWRIPPPALPHSLASKLPTAASWHTLWEPACWRRFHPPTTSRWQTHAPRRTPVDPPGPGPAD